MYGSAATGDTHRKSDLDLLILIQDEKGRLLADGFILDDVQIGYDIYCTTWQALEEDAQCSHANIAKLMDSQLVYIHDPCAESRLEDLRRHAAALLASDLRCQKAKDAFENAKRPYAECFLSDSLASIRTASGALILFLLDALMLFHGKYFRKGVKRTFKELAELGLPFCAEQMIMAVVCTDTPQTIRDALTQLMQEVQKCIRIPSEKIDPAPENICGTYEEMFSNWRNKEAEAVTRNDPYASFMNMVCLQFMLDGISGSIAMEKQNVMAHFHPGNLEQNLVHFDNALESYLDVYRAAGTQPKHFADVDCFIENYKKMPGC